MDPQILDVSINTSGNNVAFKDFFRPFQTGIKVTGPWLDVYVRTVWMRDVKNGIDVDQGAFIAGPAHFIDLNHVATWHTVSNEWSTFFRSQSRFMEAVKRGLREHGVGMRGGGSVREQRGSRGRTEPGHGHPLGGVIVNRCLEGIPT